MYEYVWICSKCASRFNLLQCCRNCCYIYRSSFGSNPLQAVTKMFFGCIAYIIYFLLTTYHQKVITSIRCCFFRCWMLHFVLEIISVGVLTLMWFFQLSAGDTGWDVFSLEYHVSGHIRTVFTTDSMRVYLRVFNFLWRAKRMEYVLAMCWKDQISNARTLRSIPGSLVHHIYKELPRVSKAN